ncbi:MAG: hypothetical protein BAJATHORv1_20186 [Candidatus Thorarchaeota archaeon]|nr:MAG: hypothetical protein BAJATHORv1_20186 [Candidatus Thorarchaeota archaeon]
MPRRKRRRKVSWEPQVSVYKPAGIPAKDLDEIRISVDEFEALKLTDFLGLNQREASLEMDVSQPTLNRILSSAREKVAKALVRGLVLRIEGGSYILAEQDLILECEDCKASLNVTDVIAKTCPECGSTSLLRSG